jgi:hypothetical protein
MNIEHLQYPIGKFVAPTKYSEATLKEAITILEVLPLQLRELTGTLTDTQLDKKYRPEGWTIRQVVHHIADSHHHSYTRFKWALTEDNPEIKAYDEKTWADLEDAKNTPVAWSLTHIEVIHQKIVQMLQGFTKAEWNRTFVHPDTKHTFTLKELACMYAWHGMHHFMHIKNAL